MMSDADRNDAIDPIVLRGRSLEQWIDREIVARHSAIPCIYASPDEGRSRATASDGRIDTKIDATT
jgi:hypothetical protein